MANLLRTSMPTKEERLAAGEGVAQAGAARWPRPLAAPGGSARPARSVQGSGVVLGNAGGARVNPGA
jgi:hypothetical protein